MTDEERREVAVRVVNYVARRATTWDIVAMMHGFFDKEDLDAIDDLLVQANITVDWEY